MTAKRIRFNWIAGVILIIGSCPLLANEAREGYSKVLIAKQYLFSLPNATAPASILEGLDATVVTEYEANTLASVKTSDLGALESRARGSRTRLMTRDDFDHIYIGGRRLDARVGTQRSFPTRRLDPPYPAGGTGSWLLQFVGPIKPSWIKELSAAGVVFVQYLPYNAYIVAAGAEVVSVVSRLPFVQFTDRFHSALKPTVSGKGEAEGLLWVQVARARDTADTLALLERLSVNGMKATRWSEAEVRVEGTFRPADVETIVRDPLVIAVAQRPTIDMSGERESLSLTSFPPGTNGGRYKKWLADTCDACGSLYAEGYYIGIADLGIDGGFHAQVASIPGEPNSTDQHRLELPKSRLVKGTSFESSIPPWTAGSKHPDSTGSLHDVIGHGTLVAGIAAGDPTAAGPPPSGTADTSGFYWGMGVAPTAGLVITKINTTTVMETGPDAVRLVIGDARLHPIQRAYIQNHSYNQYTIQGNKSCPEYFDGYYTTLSRDFDRWARDLDETTSAREETLLTVSSGNVGQQGYASDTSCHPRRYLTLPPATAKNVLAMGMAENVRPESPLWNCAGALAESFNNIAGNSKSGTATPGWFKPDLLAPASDITSSRTYDLAPPPIGSDYCLNGGVSPTVPAAYFSSTGTSFAAPAAAGAALLASRYYAARIAGNASSASPALLKAMLIAGARSMRDGIDRGEVRSWRPTTPVNNIELIIPRNPNGRVYRRRVSGTSGTVEPSWPVSGPVVDSAGVTWDYVRPETTIASFPNDRQGFGRLSLVDVLSTYPARDLLPSVTAPDPSASPWAKQYRVHDGSSEVRIVIAWTDVPADIQVPTPEDPPFILGTPLVNDLDLSVEIGSPCTLQYLGNDMVDDLSRPDTACTRITFDRKNNVEMIRFIAAAGTLFTVKVDTASSTGTQDFAIVAYNAYDAAQAAPPAPPANFTAAAVSTSAAQLLWTAAAGATSYDVQRSADVADPFVTIASGVTGTGHSDEGLQADKTYLYRVRSRSGSSPVVGVSNTDIATTILFPDDPAQAGLTPVRASHVNTLRQAAQVVRSAARLPAYAWSEAVTALATNMRAEHLNELRAAVDAARQELGLPVPAYTDSSLIPSVTQIKAIHINELLGRVK